MCRWLAYSGSPIRLEELLVKRDRSLIDQSLHSRLGATTTNGDGFGVGWYQDGEPPRVYRSTHPAWNSRMRPLCIQRRFPCRNGWVFVSWIAVPVDARMWARKSGDEIPAASSLRFRSFQAGCVLR